MTTKRPCKHAYRTMVIARMTLKPIYNSYYIPNDKSNFSQNEGFSIYGFNSINPKW